MLKKISLAILILFGATLAEACPIKSVGDISIGHRWVRSSTGPNTAAYCVLTNKGSVPDKLISVVCDEATTIELHNHIEEDGVMKMRPVPYIEIGKDPVELKPGNLHIMLMGLKDSFQGKSSISLSLHFENAGELQVEFPVEDSHNLKK